MTEILCLCGSLRQPSYNRAALEAAGMLAPEGVLLRMATLSALPLFNPDEEDHHEVAALAQAIAEADGVLIASPEYAHGISSVLKNALDWLVSDQAFPEMPVALINTSPRAHHAMDALREVLRTMSANIIAPACIELPLLGSELDASGVAAHPAHSKVLRKMLGTFANEIHQSPRLTTVQKRET